MKQRLFFFAALCAAALVSCTPKEIVVDTPEENAPAVENLIPITITASLDGVKSDMDGAAWTWKSGDRLAVYDGTAKREFTLDPSADGQSVAIFSGSVSSTEGLKAVFPFEAAGAEFGTPAIPSDQSIPSGATIAPDAMIAVANTAEKVSDSEFNFYFTSGISLLRLTPPAGATKVIIHTAAKGETLAGDSPSVTINLADADGSKQFWAAVQPAKYTGIRIFTLKSDSKYYLLKTDAEIDLSTPGKGKKLGSLAAGTEVSVIEDGAGLVDYLDYSNLDGYICADLDLSSVQLSKRAKFVKTLDGQYHIIGKWTSNGQQAMVRSLEGKMMNFTIAETCSFSISDKYSCFVCDSVKSKGVLSGIINKATAAKRTSDLTGLHFGYLSRVSYGLIENCENYGDLDVEVSSSTGNIWAGGLTAFFNCGAKDGIVSCSNAGNFSIKIGGAPKHIYLGGITGGTTGTAYASRGNRGTVKKCSNSGNLYYEIGTNANGTFSNIGGVAGFLMGHINECSNSGSVTYVGPFGDVNSTRPAIAGVAGCVFYTAEDCNNTGPVSITGTFAAAGDLTTSGSGIHTNPSFGGVLGQAGGNTYADADTDKCKISNCVNQSTGVLTINTSMNNTNGTNNFVGGVVGFTCAPVTGCHNYADISLRTQSSVAYLGGVIGKLFNSAEDCSNSGKLDMDLIITAADGKRSYNSFVGGVIGDQNQANMSLKNLNNTGNVEIHNGYLRSSLSYAGGVIGRANATCSEVSDCHNSGNITWPVVMASRTGGVAGMLNSKIITNCSNTGNVSSEMNYSQASAGGFSGFVTYSGVKMSKCSTKGTVTASGNSGGAALLVGGIGNTNQTWNDCSAEGSLNVSGGISGGYMLGYTVNITSGSSYVTNAGMTTPLVIKSGSSLNGVAVSDSDIPDKLCGFKATDYTLNWGVQIQ
ncbi:MAG: hypothetical protein K6E37_04150 [Bacteroidales bacterium]|nr:hypothetical protein [Bacteroidales bacterium]